MKKLLEVGQIVKPHGLLGAVKVQHWCDSSLVFKQFKNIYFDSFGLCAHKIEFLKFIGDCVVLKLVSLNSLDEVKNYVDSILYADRFDFNLLDGRVFIQDLLGCSVVDYLNVEKCYGVVVDVFNYGANDIYKIKNSEGLEFLIPVVKEIVINKDINNRLIFIKPMKGLFDV